MTEPDARLDVPFAGLRRNARALLFGALVLVGLSLLPDLSPVSSQPPLVELAHGRIVELRDQAGDPGIPNVVVDVLDGPRAGQRYEAFLQGPAGQQEVPKYDVGEEVVVSLSLQPDTSYIAVSDRYRGFALAAVFALFAVAVTVVGGWRGVRSLIALVLSLGVVVKVVVPLLLAGWDPVPLAVLTATAVTAATFLLTEGWRPSTLAAAIGTFCSLALTALLAVFFTQLARFTDIQGSEDLLYLESIIGPNLDLGGLLLAAVMFGALGVLDDVTVTQAATVHELWEADPGSPRSRLFARAMNVGRSHIAATVNTLVMAYVGASLPLLVLFAAGRQSPMLIASGEQVAVEIVRALVGSVGIVAAVPLTTATATVLVGARLPFMRGEKVRRAPGW